VEKLKKTNLSQREKIILKTSVGFNPYY
jgi:hypothetical protein